jgi:osmotically-inducible protein OsmY
MGWLQRLFGMEKPANAQVNPTVAAQQPADAPSEIPLERLGLTGEYDQSGLAKRVALAFDQDDQINDCDRLWVAQTSSTVVLKGEVPNKALLEKMVTVARGVKGATAVITEEVTING